MGTTNLFVGSLSFTEVGINNVVVYMQLHSTQVHAD